MDAKALRYEAEMMFEDLMAMATEANGTERMYLYEAASAADQLRCSLERAMGNFASPHYKTAHQLRHGHEYADGGACCRK